MTTPALLIELHRRGVTLAGAGERLTYDAPAGALTPDLRALLAQRKSELLAILAGRWTMAAAAVLARHVGTMPPDEWWAKDEQFTERAGICEADGGVGRADAERIAYHELAEAIEGGGR